MNVGVAYGPGVNCVEVVVETVLGCEDAMRELDRTELEREETGETAGGVLLGMLELLAAAVATEGMLALLELRMAELDGRMLSVTALEVDTLDTLVLEEVGAT